jgi:Lon protease-like protein
MPPMRLPLFPLHTVQFPHLPLPLHIFEERYRAMTADLVAEDSPYGGMFVVSMITEGSEVGADAAVHDIGTICEIRSAERFADGRWMLICVGVARARLAPVEASTAPYRLVEATQLTDPIGDGAAQLVPGVQDALDAYLATVKRFAVRAASVGRMEPQEPIDVAASLDRMLKPIQLPDDPVAASYAIGGLLQIELSRKQLLLEIPDAASRLQAELHLLEREASLLDDGALPPVQASDIGFHPN